MSSKLWVYGVRISDEGHVVIVGAQTEIAFGQEKVVRGNGKTYTLCFRLTCNVFKRIKLPTLLQSLPRMCCVVGGYEISLYAGGTGAFAVILKNGIGHQAKREPYRV